MIYTSYFANLRNLPKEITPISICAKAPSWYNGLEYKKLAPKYEFFMEWKKNKDNDYYIKCYQEQVLDKLTILEVDKDLLNLLKDNNKDIVLLCYEKPTDFCHRHLVANWMNKNLSQKENVIFVNEFNLEDYERITNTTWDLVEMLERGVYNND